MLDGRAGDIDRHYAPGAGIAGRSGAAHAGPIRDADGKIIAVGETLRDITDLQLTQQRLESMANFDTLTGLPNRNLLANGWAMR